MYYKIIYVKIYKINPKEFILSIYKVLGVILNKISCIFGVLCLLIILSQFIEKIHVKYFCFELIYENKYFIVYNLS